MVQTNCPSPIYLLIRNPVHYPAFAKGESESKILGKRIASGENRILDQPGSRNHTTHSRQLRQTELLPVITGGKPRDPPEKPSEERGILVTDGPANFIDRMIRPFQATLCLFDAQVLDVRNWRIACRLPKTPLEGPLWQFRQPHHLLDRTGNS